MRWKEVAAWRDRIRDADLSEVKTHLSPQGLRAIVDAALDALGDQQLRAAAATEGAAYPRAVVVTAGTVETAAIEWLALLLGRGSEVIWKTPAGQPGLARLLVDLAGDLPLATTEDRSAIPLGDVVIAMGSDAAVHEIRSAAKPGAVVHEHGHAWSCAWVTDTPLPHDPLIPQDFQSPWRRLAADAALHDGRGCLTPVVAFTPLPLNEAVASLAEAMESAQAKWPLGMIHGEEAQMIRARRAMARVVGVKKSGEGWSVHGLTVEHFVPHGLPRSVMVIHAPTAEDAARCASQFGSNLSTVGTDDVGAAHAWMAAGATRICPLGRMQRPPLDRIHDGGRVIAQTARLQAMDGTWTIADS